MSLRILDLEVQVRHRLQVAARAPCGSVSMRPPGTLTMRSISVPPLLFEMKAMRVPSGDQRG